MLTSKSRRWEIQPSRARRSHLFAATLLVGGSVTEASAKSRHHRHHASTSQASRHSWRDANAAIAPSSGSGRSFSGMASFYGNESGSKTASGQRFNQNAMTAAHRTPAVRHQAQGDPWRPQRRRHHQRPRPVHQGTRARPLDRRRPRRRADRPRRRPGHRRGRLLTAFETPFPSIRSVSVASRKAAELPACRKRACRQQ